MGAAGFAGLLLLSAGGVPALASSGIDEICPTTDSTLPVAEATQPAPKLASRTETKLDEVLDEASDETADVPVKAAVKSERNSDSAVEAASIRNIEFPHVSTSLPTASDSALPSFRHQMFRTDI
jgi:hypothetical protein